MNKSELTIEELTIDEIITARHYYSQGYTISTLAQHFNISITDMESYLHTESESNSNNTNDLSTQ